MLEFWNSLILELSAIRIIIQQFNFKLMSFPDCSDVPVQQSTEYSQSFATVTGLVYINYSLKQAKRL